MKSCKIQKIALFGTHFRTTKINFQIYLNFAPRHLLIWNKPMKTAITVTFEGHFKKINLN